MRKVKKEKTLLLIRNSFPFPAVLCMWRWGQPLCTAQPDTLFQGEAPKAASGWERPGPYPALSGTQVKAASCQGQAFSHQVVYLI